MPKPKPKLYTTPEGIIILNPEGIRLYEFSRTFLQDAGLEHKVELALVNSLLIKDHDGEEVDELEYQSQGRNPERVYRSVNFSLFLPGSSEIDVDYQRRIAFSVDELCKTKSGLLQRLNARLGVALRDMDEVQYIENPDGWVMLSFAFQSNGRDGYAFLISQIEKLAGQLPGDSSHK